LNQYAYAVKAYHDMLGDPIAIKRLDPKNQIPYYFTSEDVENIFSVCNDLKHLAMLQTLFYGCLRAMELCNLDDDDLDLRRLILHVRQGKGGNYGICLHI
jgi:integrase/recombinase XerD